MLNEQQLKDALTFQTYKAMQYELLSAKLEDHCKKLAEALELANKQLAGQQEILQRPDNTADLRATIDRYGQALRAIAYTKGPVQPEDIAADALGQPARGLGVPAGTAQDMDRW